MAKAKSSANTNQSGENSITIQPKKMEKLEADEYLLEKVMKAQDNAIEEMRRKHFTTMLRKRAESHNTTKRHRKMERQNRKRGKK